MDTKPKTKAYAMDGCWNREAGMDGEEQGNRIEVVYVRTIDNLSTARQVVCGQDVSIPSGPAATKRHLSYARRA